MTTPASNFFGSKPPAESESYSESLLRMPRVWLPEDDCYDMYMSMCDSATGQLHHHYARFLSSDTEALCMFFKALPDDAGVCLRKRCPIMGTTSTSQPNRDDPIWHYGIALKQKDYLTILFNNSDTPVFELLDSIDYTPYEFGIKASNHDTLSVPPTRIEAFESPQNVVIFSHGFSPVVGPNYRYIRSLEAYIKRLGNWRVIVPDYRPTYNVESIQHGHSERCRMLTEEIACVSRKASRIVLIGKSQGSAVSGTVCSSERLVRACNIVGLILLGGENPLSYNRQLPPPVAVKHTAIIHAAGDRVINCETMRQLSEAWNMTRCNILESHIPKGTRDKMLNDIAHAFLERDLFLSSLELVKQSLELCDAL